MKKSLFAILFVILFALVAALPAYAVKQSFKFDLLPNTTNIINIPVGLYNSISIAAYGTATAYYAQTVGITNLPAGTNAQTFTLTYGTNTAKAFTWTNTVGTNALYVTNAASNGSSLSNLAAAVIAFYPGINAYNYTNTLLLVSYGTSLGFTTAGGWATNNTATTNNALAAANVLAFTSIESSPVYPITGLNIILNTTNALTYGSSSTNYFGGWQNVQLQIGSASTNGVIPGFSLDVGTK